MNGNYLAAPQDAADSSFITCTVMMRAKRRRTTTCPVE
jgi:hypothetical protein